MNSFEQDERRRQAHQRLRAQRRRAGQLRGRVVVLSLITFVLLWAIVFAQMATGHDPVLGDSSSANSAARRHAAKTASASTEGDARTDSEVASEEEALETPEPSEVEVFEPEPSEAEVFGPEPSEAESIESEAAEVEVVEPEPEPVITGQS